MIFSYLRKKQSVNKLERDCYHHLINCVVHTRALNLWARDRVTQPIPLLLTGVAGVVFGRNSSAAAIKFYTRKRALVLLRRQWRALTK